MGNWQKKGDAVEIDNPLHVVCVDDYYIGKYEVTQKQWVEIMGNNPSYFKGCDNCPIDNVSWNDAKQFIDKLNKITGKSYHLPTEAQWEFAARSRGKKQEWAGTNKESNLNKYAWFVTEKTKTAERLKPNELGLHDMTGTVWEWVEDWYDKDYFNRSPKDNPTGPSNGKDKVLRGGCWLDYPMYAPTYERLAMPPDIHDTDTEAGLRLALPAHKKRNK